VSVQQNNSGKVSALPVLTQQTGKIFSPALPKTLSSFCRAVNCASCKVQQDTAKLILNLKDKQA
jgi:hypothetical protein